MHVVSFNFEGFTYGFLSEKVIDEQVTLLIDHHVGQTRMVLRITERVKTPDWRHIGVCSLFQYGLGLSVKYLNYIVFASHVADRGLVVR